MRTTLELDNDLVALSKELARQRGMTLGQMISDLARQSLARQSPPKVRNGVPLFPAKDTIQKPDLDTVNKLRDEV